MASSHSVSKPCERLLRLAELILRQPVVDHHHLGVGDDRAPAAGVGRQGVEAAEDVAGFQPPERVRAGAVHGDAVEVAGARAGADQHHLRPVGLGQPRGQRLHRQRPGEVLVLQVDQRPGRGDRLQRQRARSRATPARAAPGRQGARQAKAGARRDPAQARAATGRAPALATARAQAPRRPPRASAPGTARRTRRRSGRPPSPSPHAAARGRARRPGCGADRRRGGPSCPSGRTRSRPPPTKASASSITTTFW